TVRPILYQLQAEKLPESARLLLQTLELNINNIFSDFEVGPIAGDGQLTPREIRICELISSGLSSKEVADIIGVSETTVLSHRRNIRKKLGLKSSQGSLSRYLKSELFEASKNR
ncbi:MAG: helix-turn-helix transcriptional regulator, partial [Deltaproteobacteria bacterium]|nr:helix-turn-helix transcriptional regulator [Deltaproteobacteria bacterium]